MDILQLTTADLIELEEHSGLTLPEVLEQAQDIDPAAGKLPPAKAIAAMMFIAARSIDPTAQWDEVIRRPIADLEATLSALGEDADPS